MSQELKEANPVLKGQLQYSIIRFVPDDVRGEFINVGALVTDGRSPEIRWTDDFSRAESITDADTFARLPEWIERVNTKVFEYGDTIDLDWIKNEVDHSTNHLLQFGKPAPIAPMPVSEGMELVFPRFVEF